MSSSSAIPSRRSSQGGGKPDMAITPTWSQTVNRCHMSKRKRESFEVDYYGDDGGCDDGEEPILGRQILPVADLPEDFDGLPVDGMQYLFTVR